MDAELRQDETIAKRLERTWPYFFASFGRLTATQRAAIPSILDGRDVLVCAATASGKTEAACAPLTECHVGRRRPWTILYVSPTRALVNDLHGRLYVPLDRLGLRVDRRTGEYRPSGNRLPQVLLTTPESFDSLLCRGRLRNPDGHDLASVVALVLDEVHLLHGTPRGEQLRWLIERLRRLRREAKRKGWTASDRLQIVALSATVPDTASVVEAYLPGGEVISVPGGREIEVVTTASGSATLEIALPAYLAALRRSEKVLVFANARKRVDELTASLRPHLEGLGYQSRAHHGSLDRAEREGTETAIKLEAKIVVFATSTLEIGVDIGDIDLVVLDGPAPDIPSLLQRIGRGNRRAGTTRVMVCSTSPLESLIHAAMIDAARDGWLGAIERGPQHAIARQQVASYIFQSPQVGRDRAKVQEFLDTCAAPIVARSILPTMIAAGELLEDASGVRRGKLWLEAANRGEIHSNIEGTAGATVADEATGRAIATGVQAQTGRGLRTGGHLLEVRKWTDFKIEVRRVSDADLATGEWRYSSQPRMQGAGQPEAVRRYLGFDEGDWPLVHGDDAAYLFHFGGARRRAVIELAAAHRGHQLAKDASNEWYLRLSAGSVDKPTWLTGVGPATLDLQIASHLETLERTLGRPAANKRLPIDVRIDEVRGWLHLEAEVAQLHASRWVPVREVELRRILLALKSNIAARSR